MAFSFPSQLPKIDYNAAARANQAFAPMADAKAKRDERQRQWEAQHGSSAGHFPGYQSTLTGDYSRAPQNDGIGMALNDGTLDMSSPVGPVPFQTFGQHAPRDPGHANSDGNVVNMAMPRPASTPASQLPKSRPTADRFAVNNTPAQRSIEARPVDINYMGVDPYALKQEQITPSFWGGTPQVKDGSTDYLGGLVNYNPKEGQTGADRMGLAGGALQDAAAWLDGDGRSADHLSKAVTRGDASRKESNALSARERSMQMLAAAGDDPERQRAALMYGVMKGADMGDAVAALKYGQPEYKSFSKDQDLYEMGPNGGGRLVRSGRQKAPETNGGMEFVPGSGWRPIDGWQQQQAAVYRMKHPGAGAAAGSTNIAATIATPAGRWR